MLTVSNYHYIREDFTSPFPSIFGLTPSQFEKQLMALMKIGKFIHPNELIKNIDNILKSKTNYILITFDDGLKEQFELAVPILNKLNISALFFINSINHIEKKVSLVHKIHLLRSKLAPKSLLNLISEYSHSDLVNLSSLELKKAASHYNYDTVDSANLKYILNFKLPKNLQHELVNKLFSSYFNESRVIKELYMTKQQLKELANKKMLGSHTHSHLALGLLKPNFINEELLKTKIYLNRLTNQENEFVSYPYGSKEACAAPVPKLAKELGYKIGFTMERGINTVKENKLLLKRFDCNDLPLGKNEKVFKDEYSIIYK